MEDYGRIQKTAYSNRRMPTPAATKPLLRLLALFDGEVRASLGGVGHFEQVSSEIARRILGLDLIPPEKALLASAEALVSRGLV